MASPRPIWKGALRFALVSIPIKLYPAIDTRKGIALNQLHDECKTRLTQKRWCGTCDREVPMADVVMGYEFATGQFVELLEAERDANQPNSTHTIEITRTADASMLEWRSIDRAYSLAPDGLDGSEAAHTYAVMTGGLVGKVGIGKVAMYGHEHLVAVSPQGTTKAMALMLYTLHAASDLRPIAQDIWASVSGVELTLAQQVVATLEGPIDLNFVDECESGLRRIIAAKIAHQEIVVPPLVEAGPVLPLLDALQQSVAAGRSRLAKAQVPAKRKSA